jgi:hypothetical protein
VERHGGIVSSLTKGSFIVDYNIKRLTMWTDNYELHQDKRYASEKQCGKAAASDKK